VYPILSLVQVTKAIGDGNFASRAKVYSQDEIGKLARMFNLMAEKLQAYQTEVEEKEAFRASLIDQIVQAQEEERISVARELHDQLGQSLYKVLLRYQSVQRDCAQRNRRCTDLEEDLRGLIDEVRRLAWGIRPSLLDDFGLDSALQQYVKEISSRAGVPIDYKCGFPANASRLPDRVEVILYRVAQEALTNVIRHANANRASVVLLRHNSEVTLLVEDDGRGFDARAAFQGDIASLGLMGMRERVALVGGNLTIDSQPGKGAAVRVRIPINGDI
ncbi:MAG: HAMP domain-containing protein, partial [Candidatus Hydrogenedentes bacterium]|nr:HAMP domain-containing protein [Candidatus Hydrogenedentota bacterium]